MRLRDLPSPPGLPILGNALQIDTTRLHLIAEAWSCKYEIDSVRTPDGGEAREHLALTMSPVGLVLKLKK